MRKSTCLDAKKHVLLNLTESCYFGIIDTATRTIPITIQRPIKYGMNPMNDIEVLVTFFAVVYESYILDDSFMVESPESIILDTAPIPKIEIEATAIKSTNAPITFMITSMLYIVFNPF